MRLDVRFRSKSVHFVAVRDLFMVDITAFTTARDR